MASKRGGITWTIKVPNGHDFLVHGDTLEVASSGALVVRLAGEAKDKPVHVVAAGAYVQAIRE